MERRDFTSIAKAIWRSRYFNYALMAWFYFELVIRPLFQRNQPVPPYFSYFIISLFVLLLAAVAVQRFKLGRLRRKGLYPYPGKATMEDVQRLLKSGDHILAMRCYREVHHVSLEEAKRAVEAL
jgi:hypothetical protein